MRTCADSAMGVSATVQGGMLGPLDTQECQILRISVSLFGGLDPARSTITNFYIRFLNKKLSGPLEAIARGPA
jgi:hypothetical protein